MIKSCNDTSFLASIKTKYNGVPIKGRMKITPMTKRDIKKMVDKCLFYIDSFNDNKSGVNRKYKMYLLYDLTKIEDFKRLIPPSNNFFYQFFEELVNSEDNIVFIVHKGILVAFCIFNIEDKAVFIEGIKVFKRFRRIGLSNTMLTWIYKHTGARIAFGNSIMSTLYHWTKNQQMSLVPYSYTVVKILFQPSKT